MREVKANLYRHLSDEELKTSQYITILNARKPQTNYVTIVTDGPHFHTCIPRYDETGRVVELEKVCGLSLDSPTSTPESAAQDLKVILSDIFQEQREATPQVQPPVKSQSNPVTTTQRHPHPGGGWGIYFTKDWLCQHLLVLVIKQRFIGN